MYKLVNFIDLTSKELDMILEWRNHPNVRKWMKNNEKIKKQEHLVFIKLLQKSKNREYFLLK